MNFESLKEGFRNYLIKQEAKKTGKSEAQIENEKSSVFNTNIMLHGEEFKQYLTREAGQDVSIFSKSIDEIMQMQIVDGKLVDVKEEDSNFDDEAKLEEAQSLQEGLVASIEAENSDGEAVEIPEDMAEDIGELVNQDFNAMLQDEAVISALDIDGSGDLNIDEVGYFFDSINTDGDDKLSLDELSAGFNSIINGDYKKTYPENKSSDKGSTKEKRKVTDKKETPKKPSQKIKDVVSSVINKFKGNGGYSKSNSASGAKSHGSFSGSSLGSGASINSANNIENMSLEQLEKQQKDKQQEVNQATNELSEAKDNNKEAISAAQEDYDAAKAEYDEAMSKESEEVQALGEQLDATIKDIETKEDSIKENKSIKNDKDRKIATLESSLNTDKSNLESLKASKGELDSFSSDDPQKKAQAQANASALQSQIDELESKINQEQETFENEKEARDKLEETIKNDETELENLKATKEEYAAQIEELCSEDTKAALDKMLVAQQALEDAKLDKDGVIEAAQTKLTNTQAELDKIDAQVKEKETEETESEYSVDGEFADKFNKSIFKGTILDGMGKVIENLCKKYNVDPSLASAIIASETGCGTSNALINKNNPGGYMDAATNYQTVKVFGSLEEGLEAVIKNLGKNYIAKGITSIQTIGNKYCPVGAANDPNGLNQNWVKNVTQYYNQFSGKKIDKDTKLM